MFGPRGTWFATTDSGGTIQFHDQRTGEPIGEPLAGHTGPVWWFLPTLDGRRLATIGIDGTARVWDLETMTQIGRAFEAATNGVNAWSADGNYLSVAVRDGDTIDHTEVWNFDTATWSETACEIVGRNMTDAEWEQFGPRTIERRATCPQYHLRS